MQDKLGGIIRFALDNDLNLKPNQTYSQEGLYNPSSQFSGDDMTRLSVFLKTS